MLAPLLTLVPPTFRIGFACVGLHLFLHLFGASLRLLKLGFALALRALSSHFVVGVRLCLLRELLLHVFKLLHGCRYLVVVRRRCARASATSSRMRRCASGRASRRSRMRRWVVRCFVVGSRVVGGLVQTVVQDVCQLLASNL